MENLKLYTYLICIAMLLVGYLNQQLGHSPQYQNIPTNIHLANNNIFIPEITSS